VSELPSGWAETRIGEVLQFNYGKGLPERDRSGSGFPVYGSNGVVGYHEKALVSTESLVVGRKGSVGEVHHSRGPCWPIDTTYFVDEFSGMPVCFWYYALKNLDPGGLNRATAIPGLNREDAYQVDVLLPPQTEQKRIADKRDVILVRVDACRERLDRVPAILKPFRQAVLAAATSGQLTAEWREAHDDSITSKGLVTVSREALPPGWWWSCPEEIKTRERYSLAIGPFGSNLKVKDYRPTGVPLVFVKEIRTRNFGGPGTKFIAEEKAVELAAHTVAGGDLLITKMGDPPGDTAI
jgi:type I restriction enzyme S subunit